MKTKHTPGPWSVQITDEGPYFSEISIWQEDNGTIADLPNNWQLWNSDKNEEVANSVFKEAEANANLMAASPIMIDALRATEHTLLDAMKIDSTHDVLSPSVLLDLVQNAIQKATP